MIKTRDLIFQYPNAEPIFFPDFELVANDALLICGESGCGKTTLLYLLAGLRQPTSGLISIDGVTTSSMSSTSLDQFRGQYIGLVYQQNYFIRSLSILDNLIISPFSGSKSRAQTVSQRLNIQHLLYRYSHQLSVGQQQRASIARAVMNKPKLLLADEPTSALDNKNCAQVIDLLLEEAMTNHAALIIVTHDDRLRSEIKKIIELEPLAKNESV